MPLRPAELVYLVQECLYLLMLRLGRVSRRPELEYLNSLFNQLIN